MKKEHFEILLEDIREKFDLVLEGHEVLRADIERARQESRERDEHLLFLIQALDDKIDGVDARLGAKIDEVDTRLSAKIDEVDTRLSAKIDAVDARLSARIDSVENRLSAKIDQVGKTLEEVKEDLAAHRRDTEVHLPRPTKGA
ncbi:hypothetical protein [Deferrisoma palaeochoriense]